MTQSYVTQCPHCGTTFKVTDAHLNAANGSVRCGACLRVFSARNHLVQGGSTLLKQQQLETKKTIPDNAAAETASIATKNTQTIAEATPQSQFDHQEASPKFEADSDEDTQFLFSDHDKNEFEPALGSEEDDFVFEDDPETDDFDDLDEIEDDYGLGEISDELSNLNTSSQFSDNPFETDDLFTGDNEAGDDESWATSMLEEMEQEEQTDTVDPNKIHHETLSLQQDEDQQPRLATPSQSKQKTQAIAKQSAPSTEQSPASSLVHNIDADPLELDFDEINRKPRTLLWTALSLIALLGLAGQYAWYQMDSLARLNQWRPYYQIACDQIGCQLPEQIDLSKIKTGNIILRKNPDRQNSLIMDAILVNQAAFRQPFPELILIFSDINGKRLADVAIAPGQYLSGELAGETNIPVNTPVHISVTVANPGDKATNYRLEFKKASS